MIKLERIRSESAIPEIFRGVKRVELNKKLLISQKENLNDPTKKHEWDTGVWGKSKPQLLTESNGKCAYCEAPLTHIAYGDVEHFRPKSIYWWLAYSYENYLASCTLCNQAFKKDHFQIIGNKLIGPEVSKKISPSKIETMAKTINPDPLNEADGMSYSDFQISLKHENALLMNPYYEDPEEYFTYKSDDTLKEVEMFVEKTIRNSDLIQQAIVDDYGLNRLELKQMRYEWYDFYVTQKMILSESQISIALKNRAEEKIKDMKESKSPFAGMIRFFEK